MWLHEFPPSEGPLHLRFVYFRAYVHHSLSCDSPLEVFVSLNGDNGDVYSAKCNCISRYVNIANFKTNYCVYVGYMMYPITIMAHLPLPVTPHLPLQDWPEVGIHKKQMTSTTVSCAK